MNYPEFKEKFVERYDKLTDFEKFKLACFRDRKKSIRINTLKVNVKDFLKEMQFLKLQQINWCKEGFFVNGERTDLGNLIEHGLGYFYVQEASSMAPVEVLNPKQEEFVLDMASAPGSKTTQMAAKMNNKGILIANDNTYSRLSSLNMNLQRCGISNAIISLMEGRFFKGFEFDKILLDAPCSGTGTINKSPRTILEWNPHGVRKMAAIQKQLIKTAFENLKEEGVLVYSTCSLEPEENEGVVSHLLENFDNAKIQKINLEINSSQPITNFLGNEYNTNVKNCLRIWPQDNNTDGFFVAKIKKTN